MKVIKPGHVYEVENADAVEVETVEQFTIPHTQTIEFVRRRDARGELLDDDNRREGILTQELLRVAIDRTLYLYAEAPCDEDTRIIEHLRSALTLYESRAARRSIEKLSKPEQAEICPECHHILCTHRRD